MAAPMPRVPPVTTATGRLTAPPRLGYGVGERRDVVAAVACRGGGREQLERDGGEGRGVAGRGEDESGVLDPAVDCEGERVVACRHQGALGRDERRLHRAAVDRVQERCRGEAERARHRHRLGDGRRHVEHERVGRELEPRGRAGLAEPDGPGADGVEHWGEHGPRVGGPGRQHDEGSLLGGMFGAEDRRVDVPQPELGRHVGQARGAVDADGAGLQQHRALRERSVGVAEHLLDGVGVPQHRQHDVGVADSVGDRRGHAGAGLGQRGRPLGRAVPDVERQPGRGEVARHPGAHHPGAEHGDAGTVDLTGTRVYLHAMMYTKRMAP